MKRGVIALVLLISFCSCHKDEYKQLSKSGTNVEIIRSKEKGGLEFKVRVSQEALLSGADQGKSKQMFFSADSCFKLFDSENRLLYPEVVEPIANGINNKFEYIVTFPKLKTDGKKIKLVYHDKFFSGSHFEFDFNDN